ncbi:MAG: 23S rRNA (pseudouridine(1915)-N(3))-methyltransferase RlmH [Clostridia bacterium]|nr:23S rRNA (pseudouridine(1915)-N(3))-methyltransferase RlmH [Clostridia bacterium]
MKVNIVAVGKVKEKYFSEAIEEYSKRLSRFCDFSIIEVAEENYSKVDDAIIQKIKEKEQERIISHLKGYVFATAIEGKKYSSVNFSKKIDKVCASGQGVITFVIGGSYGLSDVVKARADELISFSDMTFPHTFFRAMLTEQVYRAFCILNNVSYHK